jgi:hypothetical protein
VRRFGTLTVMRADRYPISVRSSTSFSWVGIQTIIADLTQFDLGVERCSSLR